MDWDNIRFFLELSRAGKLTVAARRLGVDHTTVARRVQSLEKSLGTPLFLRGPAGYQLTEPGRRLLPQAETMESAFSAIEELGGDEGALSGVVRVGATEGYGSQMLAEHLAGLCRRHPNLQIDLLAVPRMVNLSRREADIVITLDRPERGPYIITKLTDYVLRLYGSRDYLARHAPIRRREDLEGHTFVGYIDDLLYSKELHYLDDIGRAQHVALRSTSILAQQQAVVAGAGLAILPAFSARQEPGLCEVLAEEVVFQRTFWMLMPIDIKDLARMRVVWSFLRETAAAQQDALMGREPRARE